MKNQKIYNKEQLNESREIKELAEKPNNRSIRTM